MFRRATANNRLPTFVGEWVTFCPTFLLKPLQVFSLSGVLPPLTFADISMKRAKVTQLYKPVLSIISLCYD